MLDACCGASQRRSATASTSRPRAALPFALPLRARAGGMFNIGPFDDGRAKGVCKRRRRSFLERRPPPRMPFVVPSSALVELPSRPPGEGLLQSRALQSILRTKLAAGERMRITAVAGAGKSTTLREYARANPALRTLYLTFNRSVKRAQAAVYAREHGLAHVEVRTLGSVAYEATKDVHEGDVRDAVDVRGALPAAPAEVVRAVGATLEAFFASDDAVVGRVHVDAALAASARGAASDEAGDGGLVRLASTIWSKLGVTLAHTTSSLQKLFQLHYAAHQPYDLVLLDEAHDCTRCEIAAVFGMPGAVIVVYDARQCINQWRHAADMAFLSALRCKYSFFLGNSSPRASFSTRARQLRKCGFEFRPRRRAPRHESDRGRRDRPVEGLFRSSRRKRRNSRPTCSTRSGRRGASGRRTRVANARARIKRL